LITNGNIKIEVNQRCREISRCDNVNVFVV